MFIGWVGVETMWCNAPPARIDAFFYYHDTLRLHLPLHASSLLGQRRMHSELRALMHEPILIDKHEMRYARTRGLPLARCMWEQDYRRAQWRAQCQHPHMPAFHSAFVNHPIRPMGQRTCVAGGTPQRPRHGLYHEPGSLRVVLLLPDTHGTCLCHEPWQLYAKCWVPRPDTIPPTMAQAPHWTMLGAWHGATRIGDGEWWMCEGVV